MGFDPRPLVRKLGRPNARPLERDEAGALFDAMLAGTLGDVQLGAAWMGLRIKGETPDELIAFLASAERSYRHWDIGARPAGVLPIVIPSYNGARQLPNLTPLLALLLARSGIDVVVHGIDADPTRVTTAQVFAAMGVEPCRDATDAIARHRARLPALVSIATLAPEIARLLDRRWTIGARGSVHTIVKMLNPLTRPAVRLVSVTHPDYLERMRACFADDSAGVMLLRGAEGEAVAHPRRALRIEHLGVGTGNGAGMGVGANASTATEPFEDVLLPDATDAATTAAWIDDALNGRVPVPPAIVAQVAACIRAAHPVAQVAD